MSLNPNGTQNYGWNYTKPDKPGFTETLIGTVVAIQEVQKRTFTGNGTPGAPEFWPEGNPKMNIRIALATQNGQLVTFTFQPASKKQREGNYGIHMDLFHLTGDTDLVNLLGKTIQLRTQSAGVNPNTGQPMAYGSGNPRPFWVDLVQDGPYALSMPLPAEFTVPQLLCDQAVSGGQVVQVPQPQPQQPVQQMQQMVQQQPVQQMQAPVQQQPQMQPQAQPQQMVQQPAGTVNPMQPAMPEGMDPQVAAAMQAVGATNVQPVQESIYDQDIPF